MVDAARRTPEKFALRLPEGMREKIARIAEANNRSSNAEIVARLEQSLAGDDETDRRSKLAVRRLSGILTSDLVDQTPERLNVLEEKVSKLEALLKAHGIET